MIKLTLKTNKKQIYIAPEGITAICDNREGGSEVYSGTDMSLVTESAEEVARKVIEWKHAAEWNDFEKMMKLAGLEGENE